MKKNVGIINVYILHLKYINMPGHPKSNLYINMIKCARFFYDIIVFCYSLKCEFGEDSNE